jgi:hypothetical protein
MQDDQPGVPPAAPTPPTTPAPPPVDVSQLARQMQSEEAGRKIKIAIILVLILVALGIAGWQFMDSHKPAPAAPTPTPITTTDVEQLMTEINGSFADIDANMVGLESALNDTQGDLSE